MQSAVQLSVSALLVNNVVQRLVLDELVQDAKKLLQGFKLQASTAPTSATAL